MSRAGALRSGRTLPRAIAYPERWALAAIVAFALIERAFIETAPDVSWLLTLGERMLAGERPYVDFIEVNPPASIYLYLPALLLSRVSGLTPEFLVGLLVFAGVGASLFFSARLLIRNGLIEEKTAWCLASAFAVVLLVLPAATFAQREHIALISFLLFLAVALLRADGKTVAWHSAVIAGVGAALTVIIKPHFVFPVVFAASAAALVARSWRPIFAIENWISAALALFYGAAVVVFYPVFVYEWIPIIAEVYVALKASVFDLLTLGAIPFWFGALLVIFALKRREVLATPYILLIASALGFLVSFFAQQKGLQYHSYPMLALIFAGAIVALFDRADVVRKERLTLPAAAISVAGLMFATFSWYAVSVNSQALASPIRAAGISNPVILNISGGGLVGMGFPLTRQLNGVWASRTCGQWISSGVLGAKRKGVDAATAARLDGYMQRDRAMLIEDIRSKKPDIILVDRIRYDWYQWAQSHAALARELENYRTLKEVDSVLILRRK
jgi:hypothetical protein